MTTQALLTSQRKSVIEELMRSLYPRQSIAKYNVSSVQSSQRQKHFITKQIFEIQSHLLLRNEAIAENIKMIFIKIVNRLLRFLSRINRRTNCQTAQMTIRPNKIVKAIVKK
jgi:hypothetical protein